MTVYKKRVCFELIFSFHFNKHIISNVKYIINSENVFKMRSKRKLIWKLINESFFGIQSILKKAIKLCFYEEIMN